MKVHNQTAEEVVSSLVTSPSGLSVEEAEQRLREYGFNEITEVRKTSLARRFLSQFTHLLAVLLWVAAFLCFVSEYFHPGEGMLTLGWAIIAVIMINAVFTFVQEYRAERALSALRKLLPFHVKVLRDGGEKEIPAREVVPGDVILLAEGDKVPADARLLESNSLRVNNAPLTGESEAVLRDVRPFDGEITRSPNIVFAGTAVVSGSARAVVFATAMSTEFGRIAHLTSGVEAGLSPLQKEIVRVTRLVATIATVVGTFFFVMGFLIGRDFWSNFIFAIGITVALIPEGMLPTVTLALAMGSQRMARRKALIKTLPSVETLGAVTVICTDKTGTLTQNRMTVVGAWCDNKVMDAAEFSGYTDPLLSRIACICNNARYLDGEYRGDPTEVALLRATRESAGGCETERLGEIPFDSDRKRMTVIALIDGKRLVLTKGAPESILPLCGSLRRNGETVEMNDAAHREVLDAYASLTDRGLRVLAFAYREPDVIPG
ncbi:MAG TPA: cation-transporting P-type ATPase [Dissulfurispiraceae bacterium]|nr:cation-transporting P-type ATPase [Dissulfurispiraceae bacterium]